MYPKDAKQYLYSLMYFAQLNLSTDRHRIEGENEVPRGLTPKYRGPGVRGKVRLIPKYFFHLNKSLHLFETHFTFLNLILTFL